jgi:ferredoxin
MINIRTDECIKCGLCASICFQSILNKGPEGIQITENFECLDCIECIEICPTQAISKEEF